MNTEEKELDNIAEILKQKAGFWSFSRLLEELWGNQGNLSLRLTEKLTRIRKGKRSGRGVQESKKLASRQKSAGKSGRTF